MAMLPPSISVKPVKGRYSCVLDPTLLLCDHGPPLVKHLGAVMNIWIARELWHILDNIHFYIKQPQLLVSRKNQSAQEEIIRVLKQWDHIFSQTDLLGLRLFWLKDKLGESLLPSRVSPSIIQDYELFARTLNEQIELHMAENENTLTSSFRDTLALAAALESTFILTHQLPKSAIENSPPEICMALKNWGVSCKAIGPLDQIAAIERKYLRHMLVQAHLSKHIWSGLQLSVIHLLVPSVGNAQSKKTWPQEALTSVQENFIEGPISVKNLWQGVQGFWYQL